MSQVTNRCFNQLDDSCQIFAYILSDETPDDKAKTKIHKCGITLFSMRLGNFIEYTKNPINEPLILKAKIDRIQGVYDNSKKNCTIKKLISLFFKSLTRSRFCHGPSPFKQKLLEFISIYRIKKIIEYLRLKQSQLNSPCGQ